MINRLVIVYYVWKSTAKNHTGMAYLVGKLKNAFPQNIELIEISQSIKHWHPIRKYIYTRLLARKIKNKYADNSSLLFMEYLGGKLYGDHANMAKQLKRLKYPGKMSGLVHLPPFKISELYGNDDLIRKHCDRIDNILVMGNSLKHFLSNTGTKTPITFLPHYVDNNYYKPAADYKPASNTRLKVIAIGNTFRDINQLYQVVQSTIFADFHICAGNSLNQFNDFKTLPNAILHGFISEPELLKFMQQCDVSLSVMHDTIGSNVIVTSLATGLPQVVSNVGSIRDYCDPENTIFCNSVNDFVKALEKLSNQRSLLLPMRKSALEKAQKFTLDNTLQWFKHNLIKP